MSWTAVVTLENTRETYFRGGGMERMDIIELRNGCLLTVQLMSWNCAVGILLVSSRWFVALASASNCQRMSNWLVMDGFKLFNGCFLIVFQMSCHHWVEFVIIQHMAWHCPANARRTYSLMDPLRLSHGCPLLVPACSSLCISALKVFRMRFVCLWDVFHVYAHFNGCLFIGQQALMSNGCFVIVRWVSSSCPMDVLLESFGSPWVL